MNVSVDTHDDCPYLSEFESHVGYRSIATPNLLATLQAPNQHNLSFLFHNVRHGLSFMQVSPFWPILPNTNRPQASGVLLQRNPIFLKAPPYLSFLCIVIGVAWLLVLPLDNYSRKTYISENALLPGQVHTYFAGSDQNLFRGYKHEVDALGERSNVEYVLSLRTRIGRAFNGELELMRYMMQGE